MICPRMRGFTKPYEFLEGIHIYRHWISEEAGGFWGFLREYSSALWGEWWLAWKVWWRHRFQIIHLCNPPDLLFLVALPFKLLFGTKIIYDVHDLWPEMFEAKFGRRDLFYWAVRIAERITYACADVVLVTNESVRDVALNRGGKTFDEVFIVRTAPAVSAGDYKEDPRLKKGRRFLIGYVGVMGDADGVSYLIDAAAYVILKLGRKDVQFLLMGTGPEYAHLIAQRDRLGLSDFVDMPGRVTNDYLFTALKTMDVGVSCDPMNSYNDHCTMNKVLEYMAFAKPQVLFDLKEGRASAGKAAIYVNENSAERFGEAISGMLDDPKGRVGMGQLGFERMRTVLNWKRSVEQLVIAYGRTL